MRNTRTDIIGGAITWGGLALVVHLCSGCNHPGKTPCRGEAVRLSEVRGWHCDDYEARMEVHGEILLCICPTPTAN